MGVCIRVSAPVAVKAVSPRPEMGPLHTHYGASVVVHVNRLMMAAFQWDTLMRPRGNACPCPERYDERGLPV